MMMRFQLILIFLLALGGVEAHAASGVAGPVESPVVKAPRLALLVDDADLEALLIAGFSGVETLGRAELPKVAAERLLAGGSLGLTNAEVALVVERSGERGVVKVVQCESGATVVVLELPKMPVAETARWIVARTQPLLGAVADPMRPRISLPGLRFVTDSAENRVTERAINLMMTARLQARGAVVLERWRMGDLVFEKSLGAQDSAFWGAARIVDGSVSAAGGRLQARVRVRDAAGAETMVQAEGETAESLADEVVTQVLAGRGAAAAAGVGAKTGTEAAVFLAEARWMLEHGLPREAWQATESSLALGVEPRREAEMLRVKAAAMCAFADELKASVLRDMSYRADVFAVSELPVRVAAATEAMLLAGDYWNAYQTGEPPGWTLEYPAVLGVRTLYTGLRVLRIAQDLGWAQENVDAVRGLRAAVRRIVVLMQDAPLGQQRRILFFNLGHYAGYWTETPAEAVAFYRRILDPKFDAGLSSWPEAVRIELTYGSKPCPPFLTGNGANTDSRSGVGPWRVPCQNMDAARAAWGAFLDALDGAPDVLSQADGLALRWQSTADKNARIALAGRIVDFLSTHVNELSGPHGLAIFGQMAAPLRELGRTGELALVREKAVDVFLTLLRSEAAVSPVIIQHIRTLFYYSEVGGREDQVKELLAALDARAARKSTSLKERLAIDDARSAIWKRFPLLRPVEDVGDAISVRSLWISGEHDAAGPHGYAGRINPHSAVWHDGRLWILDASLGRLWRIDPKSGDTVIVAPGNAPKTSPASMLVPWGHRFAITAENGVWILDESKTRWEKLDLPTARYLIGVAKEELWAVSGATNRVGVVKETEGSAVYRVASGLSCELFASSRRRPPMHPLDASLTGAPFAVFTGRGDAVLIGTYGGGETFNFFDSESTGSPKLINERLVGSMNATGTPGLLMRCRHPFGDRARTVCIELLDAGRDEFLLSHPVFKRADGVRFSYPKEAVDLPVSDYAAAWREDGIDLLGWSSSGSPWGASEAWLMRVDVEGGYVHPLRFVWSAETAGRVRVAGNDAKVFRYPKPGAKGLIVTDQGLVIMGSGMSGFWFVPKEELEVRRKKMREAD